MMTEKTELIPILKELILDKSHIPLDDERLELNQDPNNKHCININYKLPPFSLAIDENGELWHVCNIKGIDLRYQIKDDEIIIYSDDEELLESLEMEVKQ